MHCPICEREFSEHARGVALPFCSMRCKIVDAGRWLGEKYSLPIEPEDASYNPNSSGGDDTEFENRSG
ncbi:hypothetical protein FACS189419_08940 [Planctomycetales bacterium]|nr:hypothetical protein FACS189419_08940 [Planctomycetales bacterium]